MEQTRYRRIDGPLGGMVLAARRGALIGAWFEDQRHFPGIAPAWREAPHDTVLEAAAGQLADWFAGRRRAFALPLAPEGTAFQLSVWDHIARIPFGATCGYGELAEALNRPRAARAVGAATGRNPLSLIVPCHRLVAASGALVGYDGGLERKAALLRFEAAGGWSSELPIAHAPRAANQAVPSRRDTISTVTPNA